MADPAPPQWIDPPAWPVESSLDWRASPRLGVKKARPIQDGRQPSFQAALVQGLADW
jgi:hypothetical protein